MLKVGIVGLPNVGKSTLFNAILKREQALSANYPFATIEPNVGVVDVVDRRLDKLAELVAVEEDMETPPIIYPTTEFVDIAGLVEGANEGEGLGNKFLANIREVDMILHVVRDFSDENVVREHSKDPDQDTEIINNELILKDIETLEKRIKNIGSDPDSREEKDVLNNYLEHLDGGDFAIDLSGDDHQGNDVWGDYIKPLQLLTDKEMVYVLNVDESDARLKHAGNNTPRSSSLGTAPPSRGDLSHDPVGSSTDPVSSSVLNTYKNKPVIHISAKLESELSSLSSEDQQAYLKDLGIEEPGLDKITRLCYSTLGLISFFTAGPKEVKGWEIKKGSTALNAAGEIHTDFMKNFIKAEVISYDDYVKYGSKLKAKDAGRLRLEGKEYIVKDGDVIEFKVN